MLKLLTKICKVLSKLPENALRNDVTPNNTLGTLFEPKAKEG